MNYDVRLIDVKWQFSSKQDLGGCFPGFELTCNKKQRKKIRKEIPFSS
jgi:hypothetical protein